MKRAKQRKRHYQYKQTGDWYYVGTDIYAELSCRRGKSEVAKLYTGEIGTFDSGLKITDTWVDECVQVRRGKRHGK